MDPEDHRFPLLHQPKSDSLISRQHEFLDQSMRQVAFGPDNIFRTATQIQNDLGLGEVEIQAASLMTTGDT